MTPPLVDSSWLKAQLDDPNLVLLDASPISNVSGLKSENETIQIPGARYFDLKNEFSVKGSSLPNMLPDAIQFESTAQKLGINNSSKIVVYDNLGIYTSPRVWWMFKTMGHKNVSVLDGGFPAWIDAAYRTEPIAKRNHTLGDFESNFNKNAVKDFNQIKTNITNQESIVIDARSAGRFGGTSPEPREGLRSGHIPNSINIPFGDVLKNGKFKSLRELDIVFEGVDKTKPLTFSCGSGLTACIVLVASELVLKNKKAVYDGSWTEWAERQKN